MPERHRLEEGFVTLLSLCEGKSSWIPSCSKRKSEHITLENSVSELAPAVPGAGGVGPARGARAAAVLGIPGDGSEL